MSQTQECPCMHMGFKIAKIVLKAASVAAAFCISKEIHKVHKAMEKRNELHEEKHHKIL